jgi:hypothetical protein
MTQANFPNTIAHADTELSAQKTPGDLFGHPGRSWGRKRFLESHFFCGAGMTSPGAGTQTQPRPGHHTMTQSPAGAFGG